MKNELTSQLVLAGFEVQAEKTDFMLRMYEDGEASVSYYDDFDFAYRSAKLNMFKGESGLGFVEAFNAFVGMGQIWWATEEFLADINKAKVKNKMPELTKAGNRRIFIDACERWIALNGKKSRATVKPIVYKYAGGQKMAAQEDGYEKTAPKDRKQKFHINTNGLLVMLGRQIAAELTHGTSVRIGDLKVTRDFDSEDGNMMGVSIFDGGGEKITWMNEKGFQEFRKLQAQLEGMGLDVVVPAKSGAGTDFQTIKNDVGHQLGSGYQLSTNINGINVTHQKVKPAWLSVNIRANLSVVPFFDRQRLSQISQNLDGLKSYEPTNPAGIAANIRKIFGPFMEG